MIKQVTPEMAEMSLKKLMWYANTADSNEPDEQRNNRIVEAGFIVLDFIKNAQK